MFVGESRRAYRCIIPQRGEECPGVHFIYRFLTRSTRFFASVVLHASRTRARARADFFSCKYLSHARPRALSGQFNIANADEEKLIVVEMRDDVDGAGSRRETKKTRARTHFFSIDAKNCFVENLHRKKASIFLNLHYCGNNKKLYISKYLTSTQK